MAYEDLISKIEQIEGQEQKRKRDYYNSILSKLKTLEDMNYIERCRKMIETRERVGKSSTLAAYEMKKQKNIIVSGFELELSKRNNGVMIQHSDYDNIIIIGGLSSQKRIAALTYYKDQGRDIYTNIHTQYNEKTQNYEISSTHLEKFHNVIEIIDENNINEFPLLTLELLQSMIDGLDEFENQFYEICEQIVDKVMQTPDNPLENDTKTECGDEKENNEQ